MSSQVEVGFKIVKSVVDIVNIVNIASPSTMMCPFLIFLSDEDAVPGQVEVGREQVMALLC